MTLVVARISGSTIAIASDTLVTQNGKALPVSQGVIKSCALPGGVCISFSNSPELAWRDCWKFFKAYVNGADFGETISYFEKSSKQTGNEYIVAFARNLKIVKIVNGKRQESISKTLWIGDKKAYEKFREHETRTSRGYEHGRAINAVLFMNEGENSPASDLYSAMRHLVLNKDIPTVGGFVCVMSSLEGEFRNPVYCDMLYDWPTGAPEDFKLDLNDRIDFGSSGENEGYATTQFAPSYLSTNHVGFYVLRAKAAYVFHPSSTMLADTCTVIRNVDPVDLPRRLDEQFKMKLAWLVTVASGSPTSKSTSFREPGIVGDGGNQMGFFMHLNTFPPKGETSKLQPIEMRIPWPEVE